MSNKSDSISIKKKRVFNHPVGPLRQESAQSWLINNIFDRYLILETPEILMKWKFVYGDWSQRRSRGDRANDER